MHDNNATALPALSRDLRKSASFVTPDQARYLVDAYYTMQEHRIATAAQARASMKNGEPPALLSWLSDQNEHLENQIKGALSKFVKAQVVGPWLLSVRGIGPVLAAGLLAHIDINKATTVGAIERYAGLDSTLKWLGRAKAEALVKAAPPNLPLAELVAQICLETSRHPKYFYAHCEARCITPSRTNFISWLARLPWNAALKVLCWKIGESFVKCKGFYGDLYYERKQLEIKKNDAGEFVAAAALALAEKRYNVNTDAYKAYILGRLPPAHIHARAKRFAVKIFLSHFWEVWSKLENLPREPQYVFGVLHHVHKIEPYNWPMAHN